MRPAPAAAVAELNDLPALINPTVSPMAYIDTEKGMIQIELAVLDAPRTVANFVSLARRNFLGATPFHRVVPNFVVQDGDPRGDGEGGPGYTIRDEINQRPICAARSAWRSTGKTPAAASSSSRTPAAASRRPLHGLRPRRGRHGGRRSADAVGSDSTVRVWDGVNWIGGQ